MRPHINEAANKVAEIAQILADKAIDKAIDAAVFIKFGGGGGLGPLINKTALSLKRPNAGQQGHQ